VTWFKATALVGPPRAGGPYREAPTRCYGQQWPDGTMCPQSLRLTEEVDGCLTLA